MKNMLKVIASMACALALVACGGGHKDTTTTPTVTEPAYSRTDIAVGANSVDAANGDVVSVQYTLWLYDANATGNKGKQIQTTYNADGSPGTPFAFTLGTGKVIAGFDQGIPGMKVGGTRRLVIPSTMAYGAVDQKDGAGNVTIPANSTLLYEVKLVAINR